MHVKYTLSLLALVWLAVALGLVLKAQPAASPVSLVDFAREGILTFDARAWLAGRGGALGAGSR